MNFRGKWVLVTGASSGLGLAMAKQLALEHGANLLISARRGDRLEALRSELTEKAKVEVVPLVGDMAKATDVERVLAQATEGRQIYAAILNAGVTHLGHHHELTWPAFLDLLQINVTANVRMASELVSHMKAHKLGGGLMIVSSMAGVMPVPYQSAYSGTKAFLNAFGTGLAHELRGEPLSVTVFAPGGIATEMTSTNDGFSTLTKWLAPVDTVARAGIAAMRAREELAIPGFLNQLGNFAFRFTTRRFAVGQLASTYRKALAASAAARRP
ncbi:MAG: SDR family NAD(P)-dependent oxidoreductase [Archangium sp.]|nr:SDR family NAD(P)-dependent oxidoreductase [Archangium sp.]